VLGQLTGASFEPNRESGLAKPLHRARSAPDTSLVGMDLLRNSYTHPGQGRGGTGAGPGANPKDLLTDRQGTGRDFGEQADPFADLAACKGDAILETRARAIVASEVGSPPLS